MVVDVALSPAANLVRLSVDAVSGIDLLFERAIATVEQQLGERFKDGFGVLANVSCCRFRDDLRSHLENLYGTLVTGTPSLFDDYVRWFTGILAARAMPAEPLSAALRLLADFFATHLFAEASAPIVRILLSGAAAADSQVSRASIIFRHQPVSMPGATQLCDRLIQGDLANALVIATADATGEPWNYVRVATRLFQPALYRVGDLWEANRITVAQEHLATVTSQAILNRLYLTGEFAPQTGRRAMFTAVDGNQHVLGLRMLADAFEIDGWTVQYLGQGLPLEDLIIQVDTWKPEVVGLSAGLVQHLPALKRAVYFLRGELGEAAPLIMVGGIAANQMEKCWKWADADLWSPDAETAVAALK